MRNILLLVALFMISYAPLKSQIMVNGKSIKTDNVKYLQVEFFSVIGSNEVKAFIDYGQKTNMVERRKRLISERNGKAMVFNTQVDGLNWLYAQGWKVLHVYNPRSGGETVNNDVIYLFEKME